MRTIKELREAAGLTQKELASKLGISLSAVRSWEQLRHSPQFRIRARICEFFEAESMKIEWPNESYR